MSDAVNVQTIVARLNEEPFHKELSLVTFDELTPVELLQLLNDVLAYLDESHKVDVRYEAPEMAGPRVTNFLAVLRFTMPKDPAQLAEMQHEILAGARDKIYPILQSILGRLDLLKKRAYVAKFILPVQMPPEYLHDETTQTLMEQLSVLQTEFRETHKALDAMREDLTDPGELRQEITQLESERRQLLGRIDDLKTKTAKMRGFQTVFDATSRLRKEQEEEVKLSDRLMEQRAALSQAEGRHKAAARKLAETRARSKEDMSAADLVASARREADDNARLLSKVLPEATEARRAALAALQAKISGPRRSMEDVAALQRRVRETEARLARAVEAQAERERPVDAKLPLFRQQSMLLARKHHDKAVEVERARRAMEEARAEVDRREAQVAETAGSRHMRKEELAAYAASVRTKLQLVKRLKGELAAMRSETAVLGRTEQLLKSRAGNVDEVLTRLEERRGVSGYTVVESAIDQVSGQKERVDATKGAMLERISRLVTDIKKQVQAMSPILEELRRVRSEYADVEAQHKRALGKFTTEAAGFTAQLARLEREADTFQSDAIGAEQQYQQLVTLISVTDMRLARADAEKDFRSGDGQLLRDIATHEQLLTDTYERQDKLTSALTARQREITEFATEHAAQRRLFDAAVRLLEAKADSVREEAASAAMQSGVGAAGMDMMEVGGANVMTIE